jgi:hypothetical protein
MIMMATLTNRTFVRGSYRSRRGADGHRGSHRQWRARPPFQLFAKPRYARFPGGPSFRGPALDLGALAQRISELF